MRSKWMLSLAVCAALGACEPSQPSLTSSGPSGQADAGSVAASVDAGPSSGTGLTSFFDPGNFAVVTVPPVVEGGKPEVLSIKELQVDVSVVGRMARTTVTQVFQNHTSRRTEGKYAFTLPMGAAISRLAMDVGGKMMEGELVEREKARQIYESIVRRQKDPALLEWQGGQRFKTQIFPIEANAEKKVVLSYDQLLPSQGGHVRYRYSLPNLEGQPAGSVIGSFKFTFSSEDAQALKVEGYEAKIDQRQPGATAAVHDGSFVPRGPLNINYMLPTEGVGIKYASGKGESFFLIDFVPGLPAAEAKQTQNLLIALDTSAGIGQVELERAIVAAKTLVLAQPEGVRFNVVHGDHTVETCLEAPTAAASEALKCLEGLEAGGGTDLGGLLMETAKAAAGFEGQGVSAVLISDGAASLGELDGDLIQSNFIKASSGSGLSLHTLAVGHNPGQDYLAELARKAQGHALRLTPKGVPAETAKALNRLVAEPLLTNVEVEVLGGKVEGLVPHQSLNLARGQALAVMGRLDSGSAKVSVKGIWRGRPVSRTFDLEAASGPGNPLLMNFWARAVIDEMQDKSIPREKIVATSLEYGVMSRYTSFLVLENEEAYERFNIARRKEKQRQAQALSAQGNIKKGEGNLQDVLAKSDMEKDKKEVEAPSAEMVEEEADDEEELEEAEPAPREVSAPKKSVRSDKKVRRPSRRPSMAKGLNKSAPRGDFIVDTPGSGAFGRALPSDSKLGSAGGKGGGGRSKRPEPGRFQASDVKLGRTVVKGRMDRSVAERIIKRNLRSIKRCYEHELWRDTSLQGQLVLSIVVSSKGRVSRVSSAGGALRGTSLSACVTSKVRRFAFPSSRGETNVVRLPLSFSKAQNGSWEADIERLEAQKKTLDLEGRRELLMLYVNTKKGGAARAFLRQCKSSFVKDADADEQLLELISNPAVQAFFRKEYRASMKRRLSKPDAPDVLVRSFWAALMDSGDLEDIATTFAEVKIISATANALLAELNFSKEALALAGALVDKWIEGALYSDAEVYQILTVGQRLDPWMPAQTFKVCLALAEGGDSRPEVVVDLVKASAMKDVSKPVREAKAAALVIKHCEGPRAKVERCERLYEMLVGVPQVDAKLAGVYGKRLEALRAQRAQDMGNLDLITRSAALLKKMGESQAAARVLSELVEFAPHDHATRSLYAQRLVAAGEIERGCDQYAAAVQLNPAERNTFRTMMDLRRAHESKAKEVRECVLRGVSRLPVQRAVSILLTWEDPGADVDLHIQEVGGEKIFFSNRESKHGGLLYYDITNGYGPEIYVLGSGPEGEYKLSLVYYRGLARDLKGTLTILRNAGAPDETREDRPFILPAANSSAEIPIGLFTL